MFDHLKGVDDVGVELVQVHEGVSPLLDAEHGIDEGSCKNDSSVNVAILCLTNKQLSYLQNKKLKMNWLDWLASTYFDADHC